MLRKTFQILMLISIFFATVSCNNSQSKIDDKLPGIGTSLSDMNKYLTLQAPREINSFIIGNNIGLVIKNKSNSTIAFKPDYGIKIFSRDSGKWISVNNSIEYGDQGQELPQIGNSSPGMTVTSLLPELNENKITNLRILVVGTLVKQLSNDDNQALAYIDIVLNPKK